MRPGLAVSIFDASSSAFRPVVGAIAAVHERSVVVDCGRRPLPAVDHADALLMRYRDDQLGGTYDVSVRITDVPEPGTVVLFQLSSPVLSMARSEPGAGNPAKPVPAPAPAASTGLRIASRIEHRVEHMLRLDYRVVPAHEVAAIESDVLSSGEVIQYRRDTPANVGDSWRHQVRTPDALYMLERLQAVEQKLDRMIERLALEAGHASDSVPLRNVSLSPSAMRFRDTIGACQPGDPIEMELELPLDPTVAVRLLGRVDKLIESHHGRHDVRDIVVELTAMSDAARRALTTYCRSHPDDDSVLS